MSTVSRLLGPIWRVWSNSQLTLAVIQLRPLLIALGIAWVIRAAMLTRRPEPTTWLPRLRVVALAFVALAGAAKLSQLRDLSLGAQDFWLFEDMLRQLRDGGWMLTRFAPQAHGFVQHGAVHAMFAWATAIPLAWALEPVARAIAWAAAGSPYASDPLALAAATTLAALLYGPLALAAAGALLGAIARRMAGPRAGVAAMVAFLLSSQVGRITMYDVHPEAAYPALLLLWAWALGAGGGARTRWTPMLVAAALGMLVKEDAFLVFLPWFAWAAWDSRTRRAGLASLGVGLAAYGAQLLAVSGFAAGTLGPRVWQGWPVTLPVGAALLGGQHWSPQNALGIAREIIGSGSAMAPLRFIFSGPWLSLLLIGPWMARRPVFWVAVLPITIAYSFLDGPSKLWTYYSAPLIGGFWLAAVLSMPRAPLARRWMVAVALLVGGAGLEIHVRGEGARRLADESLGASRCLVGPSFVSPALIGLVPRDSTWTDRIPTEAEWTKLRYAYFTPAIGRFETPESELRALQQRLQADADWRAIDPATCAEVATTPSGLSVLYVRKPVRRYGW